MDTEGFKGAIESRLRTLLDAQKLTSPTDEGTLLVDRIQALVLRGGKRARPLLLYLTYSAYGGNDAQSLIELGAALEFHHQFLLMHDDLIDNDNIRYNGPNIVGYYEKDSHQRDNGIPQAMGLLAGDLLFSLSHKVILADKSITDHQKIALLMLINDTNLNVVFGEQLDSFNLDPATSTFSEDKLALAYTLKTAFYSTRLPMQCAALLLSLSQSEQRKIDGFAMPFGILFQLIDDYSDYFDNPSAFNNRPKYRDFREGKLTYPLFFALEHARPDEANFIKAHLGKKESPDATILRVVTILETSGAKAASRERIDDYLTKTSGALAALTIKPSARQQFEALLQSYAI